MRTLFVFAHPDLRSLNGSLLREAVNYLKSKGHEVKISDLYRMNWKAVLNEDDFQTHEKGTRLRLLDESAESFKQNCIPEDVLQEQEKMKWADVVIFQFPLWWYSMPAIMKGWVDRVFTAGFGYKTRGHSGHGDVPDKFGDGMMSGKRAMILTSVSGKKTWFMERGIDGSIDDILFPINHGILFYTGFEVVPPMVVYSADRASDDYFQNTLDELKYRLDNIQTMDFIHYRKQISGDYEPSTLLLRPDIEEPGTHGFDLHITKNKK